MLGPCRGVRARSLSQPELSLAFVRNKNINDFPKFRILIYSDSCPKHHEDPCSVSVPDARLSVSLDGLVTGPTAAAGDLRRLWGPRAPAVVAEDVDAPPEAASTRKRPAPPPAEEAVEWRVSLGGTFQHIGGADVQKALEAAYQRRAWEECELARRAASGTW